MQVNNIFLVGPMGAGKTTIGRQLAAALEKEFVDSDHEIVERTGVSIPTIFDIEGEEGFRKREREVIDELTTRDNTILATGGGAVLAEKNRLHLTTRGFVIYLEATVDQLLERTGRDRNRPLLQTEDPRGKLEALMRARDPLYRQVADLVVNTDTRSVRHVVKEILAALKKREA